MAWAHVQGVYDDESALSVSETFTNLNQATTQNNLIVVSFVVAGSASGITVSDSKGNTYAAGQSGVSFSAGSYTAYQYYGVQVIGGATQVTISWASTHLAWVAVDEFSGGMQTNATVFDSGASTTGNTNISGVAGYASLTTSQLPYYTDSVQRFTQDPNYAPLLKPSNASDLVVGAFFTSTGVINQSVGGATNGYIMGILPPVNNSRVFTTYRLTASSSEVPWASWSHVADFAVIGCSYKAPSVAGAGLVNKTTYPLWLPSHAPLYGPVYDVALSATVYTETIPATTQGNLLVINVSNLQSDISSVTDNVGNTYVRAATIDGQLSGIRLEKWYGVQVTGGATTITVTYSGTTPRQHNFNEYTGTAASNATVLDKVSTLSGRTVGAGTVNMSVPAFTPSNNGEIIDVNMNHEGEVDALVNGYTWYPGTGYAIMNSLYDYYIDVHLGDMYKLSSGASETAPVSFSASSAGTNYVEIAAAFNPAPPASPPPPASLPVSFITAPQVMITR